MLTGYLGGLALGAAPGRAERPPRPRIMGPMAPPRRTYTAEEVDVAVSRLEDPERLRHATEIVTHAAPGLARVLDGALADGGWFDAAHEELIAQASAEPAPVDRLAAVRALVDEQTRLGMLVGVAVGFELARELAQNTHASTEGVDPDGDPLPRPRRRSSSPTTA